MSRSGRTYPILINAAMSYLIQIGWLAILSLGI